MCYVAGRQFSHQNRVKLVADSDQQGGGGGRGGCGGLSSRPYEKRESRPRKNFSRPRGLQFGLIEVQSSKFIERFCKVFKDTENNTRGTREGTRTTQASSLVPPMRKNIAKTEKKRNTFVCGVWNRLNTCDAGSFLKCRRLLKII